MFANSALNPAAETPDIGPVHAAVSNQLQIDQANVSGISPVISGSSATLQSNGTVTIPSALWAQPLPQSQQQQQQQQQVTQEEAALHAAQATTELAGVLPQSSPSTSQQQHQPSSDTQESIVVAAAAAAAAVSATGQPMPPQQDSWQRRSFMHDLPQPQQQQQQQQQQSVQGINTGNTSSIYNHQQQYQQITSTLIKTSPPPPHTQIVADEPHHPLSRPPTSGPAVYGLNPVYPQSPAEVYSAVNEPYKYYNGFHYFFRHIRGCMDKRDIMRVSRAIAHFRPSLVALLRNLTREDLIFMEKSFQRALMEYEKLIGFTGTPTVVWRRTGEIALVGKEFSILTQWDRQSLITGNKFIFELMDTESAVTYWEQFAVHAFENSEHSVMSECRLVRPDGASVPCAFSFTIKRDLFGIPMAIIGNFLPIL
ncbi:Transcriptional regulator of nonfermentable carbon utilization [Dipsacomyces acuminosporus]|nr:Transcriptional regulator of nonfermentable carbon utilization [Dipsacomyces acuminosporus]